MFERLIRKSFSRLITGEHNIVLRNKTPSSKELYGKFQEIDEIGIYLHIPFCEQICPYCPYNKQIYNTDLARRYANAVIREIDFYAEIIGNKPATSFYIGGGTPTTMLYDGIENILEHINIVFNMQCDIHMESHPNHLTQDNLVRIQALGVNYLSIGVESLQDRHLDTLRRPYTTSEVRSAVERAVNSDFDCVNVDFMFALPNQTYDEIEQAGHSLVEMGVDQIAAYPLFRFPYTKMGSNGRYRSFNIFDLFKRRKMLAILENIFYSAGFERSSVWAFTKQGISKYCSVTVPLYIGLGASGGSYLKDVFYLNTFNAADYVKAFENGGTAIALALDLSEQIQMAGWLYWRIYETKFNKSDFRRRFSRNFDNVYGNYLKPLALLGFLRDDGEQIVLSDKGTYWMHAWEDLFSIDYISTLWGTSRIDPWPKEIAL